MDRTQASEVKQRSPRPRWRQVAGGLILAAFLVTFSAAAAVRELKGPQQFINAGKKVAVAVLSEPDYQELYYMHKDLEQGDVMGALRRSINMLTNDDDQSIQFEAITENQVSRNLQRIIDTTSGSFKRISYQDTEGNSFIEVYEIINIKYLGYNDRMPEGTITGDSSYVMLALPTDIINPDENVHSVVPDKVDINNLPEGTVFMIVRNGNIILTKDKSEVENPQNEVAMRGLWPIDLTNYDPRTFNPYNSPAGNDILRHFEYRRNEGYSDHMVKVAAYNKEGKLVLLNIHQSYFTDPERVGELKSILQKEGVREDLLFIPDIAYGPDRSRLPGDYAEELDKWGQDPSNPSQSEFYMVLGN